MTQGCVESSLNDPGLRILHAGIVFFFFNEFRVIVAVDWRVRHRRASRHRAPRLSTFDCFRLVRDAKLPLIDLRYTPHRPEITLDS